MSSPEMPLRSEPPFRPRKGNERRRRSRERARHIRQKTWRRSIFPWPGSRSGRGRTAGRYSSRQASGAPQKFQSFEERQTQDGEIVAIDAFEQLRAKAFELIGSDACSYRLAHCLKIKLEKAFREIAHGQ